MVITIDGPTASGKSTVARMLAKSLQFQFLSSGLLYRALSYILLHSFGYKSNELYQAKPEDVIQALLPDSFSYSYNFETQEGSVSFDGVDITSHLKTAEMGHCASVIGTNVFVREKLTELQRRLAKNNDVVLEGRDSGSVVFPNADVKFYLTASPQTRAKRMMVDRKRCTDRYSFDQALALIEKRDLRDKGRDISPLIVPKGAVFIDNQELDLDHTVKTMLGYCKEKNL